MMVCRLRIFVLLMMWLLVTGITVLAQDKTCPEIVQAAISATDAHCSTTGRNEACYGNVNLDAIPQPGISDFTFSTPGDIVAVNTVQSLTLSSKVAESGEWGIALLQLQANLPDSLPGQNVTFLLFGDVQISNGVETSETLNPLQAFYFHSGTGDAPCAEAPDSGILVQTPEGAAQIQFTVNDVNITLGSTAYLQAQPSGQMTTSVVEGEGTVTAGGALVIVPAGTQVQVPLDTQGRANGTPSQPVPYDAAKMAVLPISILPRAITIAPPVGAGGILLTEGAWTWTPGTPSAEGCEAEIIEPVVANFTPAGPFQLPAGEFSWEAFSDGAYGQPPPTGAIFSSPEPNTYVIDLPTPGFTWHYEVRVIDSTHIEGAFSSSGSGCSIVIPFEMTGESAVGAIVPAAGEWQATWVPPSISCDIASETLTGTLTWDMAYYGSFRLPEGAFSPVLLYGAVLQFDMAGKNATVSSPAPNTYVMDLDLSDTIGAIHFEVRVIDSEHMEGDYLLTKSNCVFAYTFDMTRVGD